MRGIVNSMCVCVRSCRNNSLNHRCFMVRVCNIHTHTHTCKHLLLLNSACVHTRYGLLLFFSLFDTHANRKNRENCYVFSGLCACMCMCAYEWMEYDFAEGFLCFVLILLMNLLFSTLLNEIEICYSLRFFSQVTIGCCLRDLFEHMSEFERVCLVVSKGK